MFRYRLVTAGFIILVVFLIGSLSSGVAWTQTPVLEAYNLKNLIRLHIVANSDSLPDQQIKLKVRDRLIKATEPLLIKIEDVNSAETVLNRNLPLLKQVAEDELKQNGVSMPVKVSLGNFTFPERVYPFGILPAGDYHGLRVILGAGEGKNWWCVLYPPLCLLTPDAPSFQGKPVGSLKVEYHLSILENWVKDKGLTMDQFWQGWGNFFGLI